MKHTTERVCEQVLDKVYSNARNLEKLLEELEAKTPNSGSTFSLKVTAIRMGIEDARSCPIVTDYSATRVQRLKQTVYRLGYTLYAVHLISNGRTGKIVDGKFVDYHDMVFLKWEELRTQLNREYGVMW